MNGNSGGDQGTGSGGATPASGGAPGNGSGGATFGSGGGVVDGSGGSSTASGGSGGSGPGSGGRVGSGGSTSISGGASGSSGGAPGTGGAAPSGAGVTINGAFVPKEKAVAFIHIGHSNMRGWATRPTTLRSYFFDTAPGLWSYKGTFTAAKEPTAPETTNQTQAGPGMAILHSAQAALQPGSDVQFISIGYAKGSVTSVDYSKTGTYYPIFMNWANQLKGKVTFGAIVIMLGITERHLPTAQIPDFPKRIAQLVANIRTDLGEPNLPVLFCDYEQNATDELAPTGTVGSTMIPLLKMLPGMVTRLVLVPTDGLTMQDDHHFDMQGHKDWADRAIMLMKSNNWFPWK